MTLLLPLATDHMTAARTRRNWMWGIILAGIALRVAAVLLLGGRLSFPDAADYDALAKCIAFNQEYQVHGMVASRMPGYPAFVSNFYLLLGDRQLPVLLTQAFISGITGVLVYVIGCEFSRRTGRIAAALFALDPLTIGFAATLLTETIFTTLLLLMVWLALRAARSRRIESWLGMGLIGTAATYIRAEAAWLIVPLALAVMVGALGKMTSRERRSRLGVAAIGMAVAIIVQVSLVHPWQARNAGLFPNTPPHFTTLEGISLYESVYPQATGGPMQDRIQAPASMADMNEAQRDARWHAMAMEQIRTSPGRMARLAVVKIARTWSPWLNAPEMKSTGIQVVLSVWHIGLYLAAIAGAVVACRGGMPRDRVAVLLAPLLYFTAVHALFLGSVRYRVPIMPLVHVFAAGGVSWVWAWWQGRAGKPDEGLAV